LHALGNYGVGVVHAGPLDPKKAMWRCLTAVQ